MSALGLLGTAGARLAPFEASGVFAPSDLHVTATILRATGERDPDVALAIALAVRAVREGHVCILPARVAATLVVDQDAHGGRLRWPEPVEWARRLSASPAVRSSDATPEGVIIPLVFDGVRLYLDRYFRYERELADALLERARASGGLVPDAAPLEAALDEAFGEDSDDRQRHGAKLAVTRRLTVLAGGPGTGKTRTIARLLALASDLASRAGRPFDPALAAPTGKAAQRMSDALRVERPDGDLPEATTLHRLLKASPVRGFAHDASNPLPNDLVVVDEASMVSLPLMSRLCAALRPDASLVLVGDPFQLASVEAGAVLEDIVGGATGDRRGPLASSIVVLERQHRFAPESPIARLAEAVRTGDGDGALELLAHESSGALRWIHANDTTSVEALRDEVTSRALETIEAARSGDAPRAVERASSLKVLAATRYGELGARRWSERIEQLAAARLPGAGIGRDWYLGRPILVTRNDHPNRLFNGDVGVVVDASGPVVVFGDGEGLRHVPIARLGEVETWWAMTIHKSQGSEFDEVVVTLPDAPSPVLTRELVYTAATRARARLAIVASEGAIRTAIDHPAARASGLASKLWA